MTHYPDSCHHFRVPVPPGITARAHVHAYAQTIPGLGRLLRPLALLMAAGLLSAGSGAAAETHDWPGYMGPGMNGKTAEEIPGLRLSPVWDKQLGMGISSVAVVDGRLYTMGNDGANTTVYCLNPETGGEIWAHVFPSPGPRNNFPGGGTPFPGGPTSTPVVDDGHVYVIGRFGQVFCLNADTGAVVWSLDYEKDFPGYELPTWGFSASPLIAGERLYLEPGGPGQAVVCVNKADGTVLWQGGDDLASYSTPQVRELDGQGVLISFHDPDMVGRNPATGEELWRVPWETRYGVNAANPVVTGPNTIFVSSGYRTGCAHLQISGGEVTELWRNNNLSNQHSVSILHDGHLYGFDERDLVCVDVASGEQRWQQPRVGRGALSIAGDHLIVQEEDGWLTIASATPAAFTPLVRERIFTEAHSWTMPVVVNGLLYARDVRGHMRCFRLEP